jgi:hypothetical protein
VFTFGILYVVGYLLKNHTEGTWLGRSTTAWSGGPLRHLDQDRRDRPQGATARLGRLTRLALAG